MAATDERRDALTALMRSALALPILVVPARAGAAEVGEIGFSLLGYKERGLMKVSEPILWGRAQFAEVWEVQASGAIDIVTGASPQLVSNVSGRPVQTVSGASISDRRVASDVKVTRRFGDLALSASRAHSTENDYISHAFGLEAREDLNERNTTLVAGYGKSDDRVRSSDDPSLDEPRVTREYLAGITQVLSPLDVIEGALTASRGRGWYNDPYKFTLTFFAQGAPVFVPDRRPGRRDSLAWSVRYRHHVPAAGGTLQADYRYYRDDWGVRAHTLEVAWRQSVGERWAVRPALRYYTQSAADFYSPVATRPPAELGSSDQRLAAFGGLSPSVRVILRLDSGFEMEGTVGYVRDAAGLRIGGPGSPAYATLHAIYGLATFRHEF